MSYDLEQPTSMPRPVRAARVLLFIGAGITVAMTIGALLMAEFSPELLGYLMWFAWPGVAALVIAVMMPHGRTWLFWATVVVSSFWILAALGALGQGNPRGITQLIIPVSTLVLITRRPAREFFQRA
jgi:hypothetical protein